MPAAIFCRPSGPAILNLAIQGLRTRFARPCPWLPYSAPSALGPWATIFRAFGAPSLATIFRAFGARLCLVCAFGAT
jgi:hypothetical protein